MKEIIQDLEKLKAEYDKKLLLDIVERYNEVVKNDDMNPTVYYESVGFLIERYEDGEFTINDFLDECKFICRDYDYLLTKMRDEDMELKYRTQAYNMLVSPLLLLQVVFIVKQDYKTLGGFLGRKRNRMFDKAMGVLQ